MAVNCKDKRLRGRRKRAGIFRIINQYQLKAIEALKTYRGKASLLAIMVILIVGLVYIVSIRPTWNAYVQHKEYQASLAQAANAPATITQLKSNMASWGKKGGNFATQAKLFETVSLFCLENQLKVRSMPEAQVHQEGEYEILTNKIAIQGDYKSLVALAYEIEVDKKLGRVASLDFYLKKNVQKRQENLVMDLYLQNLKLKKE